MITYFQVNGVTTDPWGKGMGFEDVFTKIDMCRKHFEAVGWPTPTSSSADPARLALRGAHASRRIAGAARAAVRPCFVRIRARITTAQDQRARETR